MIDWSVVSRSFDLFLLLLMMFSVFHIKVISDAGQSQ